MHYIIIIYKYQNNIRSSKYRKYLCNETQLFDIYNNIKSFDFKYFLIICYQSQKLTNKHLYLYFTFCLELFSFLLLVFNHEKSKKLIFSILQKINFIL